MCDISFNNWIRKVDHIWAVENRNGNDIGIIHKVKTILHFWGCMDGVMNCNSEWEIQEPSLNPSQVHYIQLHKNSLGKGMDPSLPPTIGK